jgi:hypothetical protein
MKKVIIVCIGLLAFSTVKEYKVKPTTVSAIRGTFNFIYQYLDKSNLPHQDVVKMENMIFYSDSLLKRDVDSTK